MACRVMSPNVLTDCSLMCQFFLWCKDGWMLDMWAAHPPLPIHPTSTHPEKLFGQPTSHCCISPRISMFQLTLSVLSSAMMECIFFFFLFFLRGGISSVSENNCWTRVREIGYPYLKSDNVNAARCSSF